MNLTDITPVFQMFIAFINAVLVYFLIPFIRMKITTEKNKATSENNKNAEAKLNMLNNAIKTAVKAAEQIYKSEEGEKKKSYVLNLLKGQGFTVDTAAVDAAVEAAVLDLHRRLEE